MCLKERYEKQIDRYIQKNFDTITAKWVFQQQEYLKMLKSQCGCEKCKYSKYERRQHG